eukprot:g6981.t1
MPDRVDQPGTADAASVTPTGASSLTALEEKARRLLKRCRYAEAERCFKQVIGDLEVVVDANSSATDRSTGTSSSSSSSITSSTSRASREIGAWEGLAICLSRQLDDAGAEGAQRKALALRCHEWEEIGGGGGGDTASSEAGAGSRSPVSEAFAPGVDSSRVAAAKRAALPCLRNLASFVANQGRHVDAEVVLRTVLHILEQHSEERQEGSWRRKSTVRHKENNDRFGSGKSGLAVPPSLTLADGCGEPFDAGLSFADARQPSAGVEEEKHSEQKLSEDLSSASSPSSPPEAYGSIRSTRTSSSSSSSGSSSSGSSSIDEAETRTRRSRSASPETASTAAFAGEPPASGTVSGVGEGVYAAVALPELPAASTAAAARGTTPPTRAPPSSREASPTADRAGRNGASPAPPPPSPVPPTKQHENSVGIGRCDSGGGGGGDLKESRLAGLRLGGDRGQQRESGDRGVEDSKIDGEGGDDEDPEQMAAVTRHHLAVVVHAQGRAKEAELLLEESLRVLKRRQPPQAVWVAQALHDLARVVRPRQPARACALYREALQLLEDARGVNHFLTAPTLAKLGSLLGECLVATPISPAAPAGPGAAGVARAAGLAEAVCAPAEQAAGSSSAEAVAAATAGDDGWDAKEAEAMIKRAVLIQGRHLGLRHPAVASSMRAMAELYRRQGRLSEAEPLFRRAIGIWEASPGPMDSDAVAALHGLAHCVLAEAGADWLGRFEEAFALVDQAYRIASSQPGNDPSSRLLLEALRMIRSRQRQGRGDPQPASATIMEGVWSGRWDPAKNGGGTGHTRSRSGSGDNPRCAVCLEEVGLGAPGSGGGEDAGSEMSGRDGVRVAAGAGDWTADIGSEEARLSAAENAHGKGSFAYLPCGHRFHTHCIGRWLAHSSSCPSCRSRVEDDEPTATSSAPSAASSSAEGGAGPDSVEVEARAGGAGPATRSVGSQAGRAGGEEGGGGPVGGSVGVGGGGEGPAAPRGVGTPDARAPFC